MLSKLSEGLMNLISTITNIDRAAFDKYQSIKLKEFNAAGHTVAGRTATIYALLKLAWAMLEVSPLGEVFTEYEGAFIKELDALAVSQGSATKAETESQRFMNGLRQLIISNPAIFLEEGRPQNDSTIPVIGKWMSDGLWLMPDHALAALARIKIFTQIPTVESMTSALDRDELLIHQVSGKESRKQWKASIGGAKVRGWYIMMDTPDKVMKSRAVDQKAAREAAEKAKNGSRQDDPSSRPREPQNQQQEVPGSRIPGVPAPDGPIGGKKSFVSEEDKDTKAPLRDDKIKGTPGTALDIDATVAVITVPEEFPNGSRNSLKSDGSEPIKRFPQEAHQAPVKEEHIKKLTPTDPEKVRILAPDGYRTQIPLPDNPHKYVDHLYSAGEIAEFQHWKAKDLIERGIAEAMTA